jgi:hypothetical protein
LKNIADTEFSDTYDIVSGYRAILQAAIVSNGKVTAHVTNYTFETHL